MAKRKKLRGKELEAFAREAIKGGVSPEERFEQRVNFVHSNLTRLPGQIISKESVRKALLEE